MIVTVSQWLTLSSWSLSVSHWKRQRNKAEIRTNAHVNHQLFLSELYPSVRYGSFIIQFNSVNGISCQLFKGELITSFIQCVTIIRHKLTQALECVTKHISALLTVKTLRHSDGATVESQNTSCHQNYNSIMCAPAWGWGWRNHRKRKETL